ncbi:MAG: ABC transporter permease [Tenericutes bacterium]|nr:ABC transporter permease [Mycoplasmatota bacterium]
MIVFNTFWKVINKYKGTIILFTVMLVAFGGINTTSSNSTVDFTNSKPDIAIVNKDENKGLTKNLISYLKKNTNVKDIKNEEEALDDALFYREVNYIIYIPKDYHNDVLSGKTPEIDIKTVGDYTSSLAEMLLTRYLKIQSIYSKNISNEQELVKAINQNLTKTAEITITSKIDTSKTSKVSRYFNFASYSIMFIIIFVICMVSASFNEKTIKKRTIISSMNYKTHNKYILRASFIYSSLVWLLYMILGVVLFSSTMLSIRGLIYSLNAFIFTFSSLTLALLLSTLINDKNAVNGIVNVIALGSAFLCGAFIPTEWLPESVITISRIFPTYWYVNSNDLLTNLQSINMTTLKPILINMLVVIIFSVTFIILNNLVAKKKQKVG